MLMGWSLVIHVYQLITIKEETLKYSNLNTYYYFHQLKERKKKRQSSIFVSFVILTCIKNYNYFLFID